MRIPRRNTDKFVREIASQCMVSRQDRGSRGNYLESFVMTGSEKPDSPSMYNKVFTSLDDLESLLFSPVSLRFHIADPDIPNILNESKGRAAASKIRQMCRQADADTKISQAVNSGLVKGAGILKQTMRKTDLRCSLIKPEDFGVLREDHAKLDEDMGAFCHSMLITFDQFSNLIYANPDRADLLKKAKRYMRSPGEGLSSSRQGSAMNVVVGGMYPLQAAGGVGGQNNLRGVVDWMGKPKPSIDPTVAAAMLELLEVWIWDDEREDWATFQLIGDDILIMGKYTIINALAYDQATAMSAPPLKGVHPYTPFVPNPVDDYFWGRSEVPMLILLQEAINSRIIGTNRMLRMQEDPSIKFVGATGVNQNTLARFKKPGGYWSDTNPSAKVEKENVQIPQDLWASLHEYERMFDDLMGLPPTARGHGEKGVRSGNHAEALVRMFSPRFKDRALVVERCVEDFGALTFDLCRAHIDKKLLAWVPQGAAGLEGDTDKALLETLQPPAPGLVPVYFQFGDLPDDVRLTVDSHSASPAFSSEAKGLAFDLLKVGAMSPSDLVEHVDAPDPDELQAGIMRRDIAKAEAHDKELAAKAAKHSHK